MDEDVQMVDVNKPKRESDEFEDGVKADQVTRYACTKV